MRDVKKTAIFVLSSTVVGLAGVVWWQYRELQWRSAQWEESASTRPAAGASGAPNPSSVATTTGESSTGTVSVPVDATPDEPKVKAKSKPQTGWHAYDAQVSDPVFEKALATQMRAQLQRSYGALLKEAALTPEQGENFLGLLYQKQQAVTDVVVAARKAGISPKTNPSEFKRLVTQAEAAFDLDLQRTLGSDGYVRYQTYQQAVPERNLATQLQQQLAGSDAAISDEQLGRFVQTLAQAKLAKGGDNLSTSSLLNAGGIAKVTDETTSLAQGLLTEAQLKVLKQIQSDQEFQKLIKGKNPKSGGG